MGIARILKKAKNDYVIRQVNNIKLNDFPEDEIVRNYIIFSGRVQRVGFRLEVYQLALRLGLTGWIKNLEDGKVEMEIQGMRNKIDFLLEFMNSLIRIRISKIVREDRELVREDRDFKVI